MKKQWVILLVFVGLLLPSVALAAAPETTIGHHPNTDIDIWINPLGWHRYWYSLDAGDTIYVDIEVTEGPGIDFFICDDENWDIWEGGDTASVYRLMENRGSVSTSFTVPSTDTWHIVFDSDSLSDIRVEGYIGLTPQFPVSTGTGTPVDSSFIGGLIIFAVIIFLIGMAVACCKKLDDNKEPQSVYVPAPRTEYQQTPVQKEELVLFCQYCGTQRQSLDAHFCSRCGKSFA